MEPVVKAADLEGNCLFSPPAVFGSGGLAILKRETPNSCASIATFTVFVNVKSRVRRDKEPKTEIIVSRLFFALARVARLANPSSTSQVPFTLIVRAVHFRVFHEHERAITLLRKFSLQSDNRHVRSTRHPRLVATILIDMLSQRSLRPDRLHNFTISPCNSRLFASRLRLATRRQSPIFGIAFRTTIDHQQLQVEFPVRFFFRMTQHQFDRLAQESPGTIDVSQTSNHASCK